MNSEVELPADVVAEIKANRKITAIKLLREHERIDLKEAKERVDAYLELHPSSAGVEFGVQLGVHLGVQLGVWLRV